MKPSSPETCKTENKTAKELMKRMEALSCSHGDGEYNNIMLQFFVINFKESTRHGAEEQTRPLRRIPCK